MSVFFPKVEIPPAPPDALRLVKGKTTKPDFNFLHTESINGFEERTYVYSEDGVGSYLLGFPVGKTKFPNFTKNLNKPNEIKLRKSSFLVPIYHRKSFATLQRDFLPRT